MEALAITVIGFLQRKILENRYNADSVILLATCETV